MLRIDGGWGNLLVLFFVWPPEGKWLMIAVYRTKDEKLISTLSIQIAIAINIRFWNIRKSGWINNTPVYRFCIRNFPHFLSLGSLSILPFLYYLPPPPSTPYTHTLRLKGGSIFFFRRHLLLSALIDMITNVCVYFIRPYKVLRLGKFCWARSPGTATYTFIRWL